MAKARQDGSLRTLAQKTQITNRQDGQLRTLAQKGLPRAVTDLSATNGVEQSVLTWTAPYDGDASITDYKVEFKLNSDSSWTTFVDPVSGSTGATVTGLTGGSLYDFRVSGINTNGTGPVSNIAMATPTAAAVSGGVTISGTHATQLIGPRAARQDPVEFTFWLKSELIVKVMYRFQLLSTLLRVIQSNIKLKSLLLLEVTNSLKLKSMLIKPVWERIKFQSSLLTKTKSSFMLGSKTENKKLKKALLRKLREYLDEDG